MKTAIASVAALLAALSGSPVAGSVYQCEVDGVPSAATAGAYRLLPDASGGSMGNPAQRSAFELRDARTGATIARCPRGFRDGRLVCSSGTPGATADRFVLERATGGYSLRRTGAPVERGRCRPGRG